MKNFRFKNIWLLSHQQKTARGVRFHPSKNLILGRNHTGKSSLIRSLFETLGATPQGTLLQWDKNTISVVEFSVDGVSYYALHQLGNRSLFRADKTLIVATSSHSTWCQHFADVTGFNLLFTDKASKAVQADPSCFFLPFYVNQDGSWQHNWNTFTNTRRYNAPWKAILEYFSGVKPPEFYLLNAERDDAKRKVDELQKETVILERARQRLNKTLQVAGPKIRSDNFEAEIADLTLEVTELNKQQEVRREELVKQQELLENIRIQIQQATRALGHYDSDMRFYSEESAEKLTCPTCGAEHDNFLDMLSYAEDARVLRELIAQLRKDESKIQTQYQKTYAALNELDKNYFRIAQILQRRRGDLQFSEVVESLGAEKAFGAFDSEAQALKKELNNKFGEVHLLEKKLKELTNPKRTKAILSDFRSYYASARNALSLPQVETSNLQLSSRPDMSGSGGPRAILAYYSAIWRACLQEFASYSIPIVIDSPNQNAQDQVNLSTVIKFIATELPSEVQLIVGLEEPTDYVFDYTLTLEKQYQLLQESDFEKLEQWIAPMVKAMFSAMWSDELPLLGVLK